MDPRRLRPLPRSELGGKDGQLNGNDASIGSPSQSSSPKVRQDQAFMKVGSVMLSLKSDKMWNRFEFNLGCKCRYGSTNCKEQTQAAFWVLPCVFSSFVFVLFLFYFSVCACWGGWNLALLHISEGDISFSLLFTSTWYLC